MIFIHQYFTLSFGTFTLRSVTEFPLSPMWCWTSGPLSGLAQGIATGYEPKHTGFSIVCGNGQTFESCFQLSQEPFFASRFQPTVIQQLRCWFEISSTHPILVTNLSFQWILQILTGVIFIMNGLRHCKCIHKFGWCSLKISQNQQSSNLGAILVRTIDHAHQETISLSPSYQVIHSRSNQNWIRSKGISHSPFPFILVKFLSSYFWNFQLLEGVSRTTNLCHQRIHWFGYRCCFQGIGLN